MNRYESVTHTKTYTSSLGLTVTIEISEEGDCIEVSDSKRMLGSISLAPDDYHQSYYITHLDLEGCKRQGIGRECLKFHKEIFGATLTAASPFNTFELDDGSHLTGDGLPFVSRMRTEGIIAEHPDELDEGDSIEWVC